MQNTSPYNRYLKSVWNLLAQDQFGELPSLPIGKYQHIFQIFILSGTATTLPFWVSCSNVYCSQWLFYQWAFCCVYRGINWDMWENENVVKCQLWKNVSLWESRKHKYRTWFSTVFINILLVFHPLSMLVSSILSQSPGTCADVFPKLCKLFLFTLLALLRQSIGGKVLRKWARQMRCAVLGRNAKRL